MLHVSNKGREAVRLNLALQLHRTLYDSSESAICDFLKLVQSANQTVVVVVEQESDHNGGDSAIWIWNLGIRLRSCITHRCLTPWLPAEPRRRDWQTPVIFIYLLCFFQFNILFL